MLLISFVLLEKQFERRIFARVMPEEESLLQVDGATEPLREIRVVQTTLLTAVLVCHQLFQIGVIQRVVVSEVLDHVLHGDVAVIVLVKKQKRLLNFGEVVGELEFKLRL